MMSFSEHITEQEDLEERLIRTGAITSYGAQSRKEGDASVRAFKQGQQALKGGPDVALEDRVKRIEQALDHHLRWIDRTATTDWCWCRCECCWAYADGKGTQQTLTSVSIWKRR